MAHTKTPLPPRFPLTEEQREDRRIRKALNEQVTAAHYELRDYVYIIIRNLSCNIADELYKAGRTPSFSHNIGGDLTCGYGALSSDGEWQFPLSYPEFYRGLAREEAAENCWKDQFLK